ncbi:response regulator [Domibacillus mangrovi]|uniref:Response regulatory domain-containing protein n=1 Tax=Domibacillus mangrovi TaxID=1714354 RepID=A0A1Q5P6U2_9BACI|nr:response regulator [Domibacillus mangrovi]OKL37861.1 hypothetical protein BLL40_00030 [Domibacillus mangrovi]
MIRVILVDDEPLALRSMEKKLNEFDNIEVVQTFSNVETVFDTVKNLDFQVAFLDIEMPRLSGLELAELLRVWHKNIHIVFVTAHRDYAIQAFELHSVDYLLKPILKSRLAKTIERLEEQLQLKSEQLEPEQQTASSLKIQCLGEFMVYCNNQPITWKTSKVRELFAFFTTHYNLPVHRDTIIDNLWPNIDYSKAKIQLHTTISYLRKSLASIGYSDVLLFSNECYVLQLNNFHCDSLELEQLVDKNELIGDHNIGRFQAAVQSYYGDYMEKTDYQWAIVKARMLRDKLTLLLQRLIDYYTATHQLKERQYSLILLLHYNPYSEKTLQQLMQHYYDTGNRGSAIKVFREFKERLLDELGILPDRITMELYAQIIREQ